MEKDVPEKNDNLAKSEVVVSKVLGLLMDWGLQDCNLEFSELELSDDYAAFFFPCIAWLESEGVIRVEEIFRTLDSPASGVVRNPALTSFGLDVLGRPAPLLDGDGMLADAVRHVDAGHGTATRSGNFVGGLIASFVRSFG